MDRRKFFAGTLGVGISALMVPSKSGQISPFLPSKNKISGYGPLVAIPSENTGEYLLALPEGFKYNVFGKARSKMSDGRATPPKHDGMAAFDDSNGMIRLVRNHEIDFSRPKKAIDPATAYDPTTGGGTTTLVIDPVTRLPIRDFVSLSGTHRNCSGGPTPWQTWLSCEETVAGTSAGFRKNHGYVFEVSPEAESSVSAKPIKEMGRFYHEAAAVDPQTGFVYLTEDRKSCGFYRFKPKEWGNLSAGGTLQMLAIKGFDKFDTRKNQSVGKSLPAKWVDIPDPDPSNAESDSIAVFRQGRALGGAKFSRLEGCCYRSPRVLFTSTNGGNAKRGQVWEYRPVSLHEGNLRLLYESASGKELDYPDNVSTSKRGGLVFCEDGSGSNYLRGLGSKGEIFDFAKNIARGHKSSEFAGATFSPDGKILFVNIQKPGLTFAIWGDWKGGQL